MTAALSITDKRDAVRNTAELRRVLDLPRREEQDLAALASQLTDLLAVRGVCPGKMNEHGLCDVCESPMELREVQALALHDMALQGGALLPVGVGEGKTLIFWLAAYVLGAQCVLGLLPASLIKNAEDARAKLSKHWLIPNHVRLLSYELLGRAQSEKELENPNFQPDFIVCDEAHRLKNLRAACTRRVARYMAKKPRTRFVGMSGTIMRDTLFDFVHLLFWALKEGAPLPTVPHELDDWASALDELKPGAPDADLRQLDPGALLQFCNDDELKEDPRTAARRGFRRRLTETPGVVAAVGAGEDIGASIYVNAHTYDVSKTTEDLFRKLRGDGSSIENRLAYPGWERSDGKLFEQGVEVWACARQLALGFNYKWDPEPPKDWMDARRAWSKFVRGVLTRSRTLDSPSIVVDAIDAGRIKEGADLLEQWRAAKSEPRPSQPFRPNTVAVWHDESVLEWCARWAKDGGILWTEHHFFAQRLAREIGLSYYGPKGFDAKGQYIEHSRAKAIIASIDANRDGKNLQTQGWERMLFVSPPDGWDAWQQAIARIHRMHYRGDSVQVDFLFGCREHHNAWLNAMAGTIAAQDTVGAKPKLILATIDVPTEYEVAAYSGFRWQ